MLALFCVTALLLSAYAEIPADATLAAAQSLADSGKFAEAEAAVRRYLETHARSAEGHYLLGYILFKEDNPKPSLAEYAEGARLRSPTALDLEVMGCDYFLLEDYATADKWLTASARINPKDPLALYFLARTKYNEKHFEEAIDLFSKCLSLDPQNVRAAENLGLSYERLGKPDDALKAYQAAITSDRQASNHNAGPYLDLGTLLVENNHAPDGIVYLLQAVEIAGDDSQAHRELGKAYLVTNQLEEAQTQLERALELDAQSAPAHFLLAQVYRKQGLAEKARAETERYSELAAGHSSPDDALSEARALVEAGKFNDAGQIVRRYLEIHRNSADSHYLLGYILFKQQRAKDSLAEYTEGAKYRTPSAHDLEVVGGDYVLLKDYGDADKWLTKSVEWNPANLQALYYLGRTKYNENRFEEAIDIFLKCLKLDPKNIKAEDNLGLAYEALGRVDEAIAAYRTAISWESSGKARDSGPYIDLGNILVENNRSPEALPSLLEAVKISPRDLRAHRALGKAYLRVDQLEKAQVEFETCVELAPESAPTHFMLAQVYRKRGLNAKAQTEIQRYAELSGSHSSPESSQ
jgi:tetratricopeptide (TPR) repeat protein